LELGRSRSKTAGVGGTRTLLRLSALVALVMSLLAWVPASAGPPVVPSTSVSAYFFGDSLMAGTGAQPRRPVMARVAAAQLGWEVEVDAWGGTGFTTTGDATPGYLERLQRPGALAGSYDVVVLQGGTNDARIGSAPEQVQAALREVVALVRERQPQATVVLMGAYDPPAHGRLDPHRAVVDAALQEAAAELGLPFLSPISGGWSVDQPPSFLSRDGLHPTAFGYGVMGTRLAQALQELLPS
jgi:lysophospholipase L1-like esterase